MGKATSEDDVPAPTRYTGPSGVIRNSNWLTNEDIPHDRDTMVTIEVVNCRIGVKFQGGRKKPKAFSLKFVGKERELLVNATHKRILNAITGSTMCGAWEGLKVWLYVQQDVGRPDGTAGPAIRIRAKKAAEPEPATPQKTKPQPPATVGDVVDQAITDEVNRTEGTSMPQIAKAIETGLIDANNRLLSCGFADEPKEVAAGTVSYNGPALGFSIWDGVKWDVLPDDDHEALTDRYKTMLRMRMSKAFAGKGKTAALSFAQQAIELEQTPKSLGDLTLDQLLQVAKTHEEMYG